MEQVEILKFIQKLSNPALDIFFQGITILGEKLINVLFFSFFLWCIDKKKASIIAGPFLFSLCINGLVKNIFKVARPIGLEGLRALRVHTATGYSFPSGHTQGATAFWGSLSIYFRNKVIIVTSIIIVLLVSFSRLYLGVHWPTDTLGAITIGMACVLGIDYLYKKVGYHRFIKILIGMGIIGLLVEILFIEDKDYASGVGIFLGFYIGIFLENKYVHFHEKGSLMVQIAKMVIGLAFLLLVKELMEILLPNDYIFDMIQYLAVGIAATFLAPLIFKKLLGKNGQEKD